MPTHLFYDKACQFLQHLIAQNDDYFRKVGFPVDLFHAMVKHSEGHEFCNKNCNPTKFVDMFDEKNQCVFNSSACEQINAWFGGFGTMCREMVIER